MESSQKSNTGLKIGLGILLVLFLGSAFIASKYYTEGKEREQELVGQKQEVMNDLNNMAKQYDEAIAASEIKDQDLIEARGWGNNELQYYTDRPENVSVENVSRISKEIKWISRSF